MKSSVSVGSTPGASANGMAQHHVKGCLEDISPDNVTLHHGTNDLKSRNTSEKIFAIQSEKWSFYLRIDCQKWQSR